MAKLSKNQIALQANEQALEKAKADLSKAQNTVTKLVQKIPELERACAALRVLCDVKPKQEKPRMVNVQTDPNGPPNMMPVLETPELPPSIPPEIAAKLPAEDLSQMGSIPAVTGEFVAAAPDDENFYLDAAEAEIKP